MQENQPINTPNFNEANQYEENVVNEKNNTLLYLILGLLVLFLILTFFYLGMMFGKNQNTISNNTDQTEIKENVDKNEGSENQEDKQTEIAKLPENWSYQKSSNCNVNMPVPNKVLDANRRFWRFGVGGASPLVISLLNKEYTKEHRQAIIFHVAEDEASGSVNQSVYVSCIENAEKISDLDSLLKTITLKVSNYNDLSRYDKGMGPQKLELKASKKNTKWNKQVLEIDLSQDDKTEKYFLFLENNQIYEVKQFGYSEEPKVINEGKIILDNLQFYEPISQIISLPNETMHYYNNDFGFLIRYPKYNKGLDSCVPSPDPENGKRELDVFEDLENNTIFISEKVDVFAPHKNTTEIDYSKCTMTENNLERLKNTTRWKVSFMYSKINGKEDLDKLASKMFSPNELKCYAGKQTYNPNGYFDIELSDKDGNKGTFENGCPTNFAYTFAYNKEKGVAVISSGSQEAYFNGTNGQYDLQVGF